MAIQVNIFEAGSVPTAQELVTLINELNTTLDESVSLTGEQSITGVKTFLGSKLLKFKQKTTADKLGFTFYDNQGKEVGNFEYDNKNNFRLLALGNYFSAANQEIEGHVGFKVFNKSASSAYRLICPLAGNAKNSIPSLSETYTNFYMPLVFTNGAASVMADNNGKVDLSTLISSGGDISGLAAVATSGDYNDLLNRPILFSGNYNDLTNKPTLFSGSYGDLTDKPTLFSGDYNDLTNKPTIPVVDLTNAQADELYQPKGNYALTEDLFSGSYNDLTDKPSLFSGNYNDLTNKPTLFSGSYNDLTDKPTLFSGSYNDLSDKPTIPTVPTISTNITSDAASDTKTTSPKAVKDFVEGKGYLTQHQDISGKADQTDLEALEDRVEALEQGDSGSTDEDKCVKLVKDPANYLKAGVGDIIKYNGLTTSDFKHGHDYECTKKGNVGYSVSSGDYVLDVAESATNEDFIAAMANEVKPFKYSESVALDDYTEYCAVTNPNVILGCSNKSKANLVVGDVLVSLPYMTPVSVITAVSGSTVTAKFLSGGIDFEIKKSDGDWTGYAYIFTNPEDVKVIIRDNSFLRMMEPDPLPQSNSVNISNITIGFVERESYSGTGTNITITKYYQSANITGTPSEWVEAKPYDCNDGGDTTQYSYLKLIPDLDAYTEAPVGEIVKYTGQTNNKYTRGWDYECITAGSASIVVVPQFAQILDVDDANQNTEFATFMSSAKKPFMHTGETVTFDKYQESGTGTQYAGYLFPHGQTPQVGDYLYDSNSLKPCLVISNDGTTLKIQYGTGTLRLQSQSTVQNAKTFYMFTNPDNIKLLIESQNQSATPKVISYPILDYTNNINYDMSNASGKYPTSVTTFYSQSDTITYGSTPEWQPIIHPTAPVNSGD